MEKYVFRDYDAAYKIFFASEKNKLKNILSSMAKIEHTGSTSIPGLGGKGVIDITVGIETSEFEQAKEKLEKAGYEFIKKASNANRLFLESIIFTKIKREEFTFISLVLAGLIGMK